MASAEREPITGIWDGAPDWGLGGLAALKLKAFSCRDTYMRSKICKLLCILQIAKLENWKNLLMGVVGNFQHFCTYTSMFFAFYVNVLRITVTLTVCVISEFIT